MKADSHRFWCEQCSSWHEGFPTAFRVDEPTAWRVELLGDEMSFLDPEQCVVQMNRFFVRARVVIPFRDAVEETFEWNVWVELEESYFARMDEVWEASERHEEPPYPAVLDSALPGYSVSTTGLRGQLFTQRIGVRPVFEVVDQTHPLALEQRSGITRHRAVEISRAVVGLP